MQIFWGKILTSKTIWIGVLMVVAAIVEFIANAPVTMSTVQLISGILAIVIRFLTNDSLIEKK